MIAVVRRVNKRKNYVVFEAEQGDFGWFDILDTNEVAEEDALIGNFHALGEQNIIHRKTGKKIKVYIEDYGMSYQSAESRIFM